MYGFTFTFAGSARSQTPTSFQPDTKYTRTRNHAHPIIHAHTRSRDISCGSCQSEEKRQFHIRCVECINTGTFIVDVGIPCRIGVSQLSATVQTAVTRYQLETRIEYVIAVPSTQRYVKIKNKRAPFKLVMYKDVSDGQLLHSLAEHKKTPSFQIHTLACASLAWSRQARRP